MVAIVERVALIKVGIKLSIIATASTVIAPMPSM